MELKKMITNMIQNGNVDEIDADTNLMTDYGFDSIMLVQLIVDIEEKFDFVFPDEYTTVDVLSKFSNLVQIINEYKNK